MSRVPPTYRRLFRREVLDICGLIFIADIVTGVPTPIFPLYATSLGASLGLLGVITSVLGLGRLLSALPIGMLSDRLNRKWVLVGGMLMFGVAFVAFAASPSAGWLVVPRLLQAVAMVATFPLGVAYIGDVVESRDRGAASGGRSSIGTSLVDVRALRTLGRHPAMLMACVANIAMTLSMTGAIFTYFPVYARAAGISTVTIGSVFAWRSIASASGRIPMGPLSTRLPVRWTLPGVLLLEAAIDVTIAHTTSASALTALLILEGIGFGIFLVSGQSGVAAASGADNRGAAVGMFWMAGSVGELFGPLVLGAIAQTLGVIAVFNSVAVAVTAGAGLVAGLGAMEWAGLRRAAGQDVGQDRRVDVASGDDAHHAAVATEPLQAGRH